MTGCGLPPVEIRRTPGTVPQNHVPIGTRDPDHLTLLVDGASETLRSSEGFLTRHSYRVEVVSGVRGCGCLLVPDSLGTSSLLRDERLLGVFTSTGDGNVTVEWEAENGSGCAPEPYEASVGVRAGRSLRDRCRADVEAHLERRPRTVALS
jgi:hypothetical protein